MNPTLTVLKVMAWGALLSGVLFTLTALSGVENARGVFGYAVVFYSIAITGAYKYMKLKGTQQLSDTLRSSRGVDYPYSIGDNLLWYRHASDAEVAEVRMQGKGTFSGIEVQLPKAVPHVYLDNLTRNGKKMRFVFDPSQKIRLEGDFAQYFMLYAPRGHEALALSVISPDVMHTIMHQDNKFDVELDGTYLRIISGRDIKGDLGLQQALLSVAQRILAEFDSRISWNRIRANATVQDAKLIMYPFNGIRIWGRYVVWRWVIYFFYVLLCVTAFLLLAVESWQQGAYVMAIVSAVAFIGGVVGFMAFIVHGDRQTRFRSDKSVIASDDTVQW